LAIKSRDLVGRGAGGGGGSAGLGWFSDADKEEFLGGGNTGKKERKIKDLNL
jgi:hypothetical protein